MGEVSAPRGAVSRVRADVRPRSAVHRMARRPTGPPARPVTCPGFAEQYQANYLSLLRLAALLTGDQRVAEAVVADCFVTLHSAWKAVGSGERAWRYLLRLVVVRSRRAARHSAGHQRPAGPSVATAAAVGQMRPQLPAAAMMVALRAVPQRQREAIALTRYLDLSDDQAAAAMGVRKATLRRLLAQGLAILGPTLPASP
jgi:DNA-directed RNA polymerase specialized sigma24 family protein